MDPITCKESGLGVSRSLLTEGGIPKEHFPLDINIQVLVLWN